MKVQKAIPAIIGVAIVSFFTSMILFRTFPKAQSLLKEPKTEIDDKYKDKIHYTAIGDSLTEGIGDDTGRGGFVSSVANGLQDELALTSVEIDNYGVSGNRSDQILKRITEQDDLQKNIASSDIITLTVGGNDVMKVIKGNIFGLTIQSFERPQKKYAKNLKTILETIRELNSEAPIYVLSFYNPFYFNFPEITDMQTIVSNWNQASEDIVEQEEKVHFIDINELITNGSLEEPTVGTSENQEETQDSGNLNRIKNDLLSDADNFHPNNLGYQLISKKTRAEIVRTKEEWLLEEAN